MTWRWPWVSRARLEDAQAAVVARDAALEREAVKVSQLLTAHAAEVRAAGERVYEVLKAERERHAVDLREMLARHDAIVAGLVAQIIELKKQDYGPAAVIPTPPQHPVTPIPPEVMKNIARTTDPETRERRMVERRVRDLLAAKVPAEEVSKMVLVGEEIADDLL